MIAASDFEQKSARAVEVAKESAQEIGASLLTGGRDRPYAAGLVRALASQEISLQVIGGEELKGLDFEPSPKLDFINLYGNGSAESGKIGKLWKALSYYVRVVRYAASAKSDIFHTLWNGKLEYIDRTVLLFYFRLLGKKTVFTAHNVNAGKRDGTDSLWNRLTLRIQYRTVDHIFVHTEQMKNELVRDFKVRAMRITVIPFGINNAVPQSAMNSSEAKRLLGLKDGQRVILFFGNIGPYKGVEHLVTAFKKLHEHDKSYRLIIAGKHRTGAEEYVKDLCSQTLAYVEAGDIIQRIEHVPDEETEIYFKAADVLVLPYTSVSQSGVLFLGHSFGLPVVATDVGSLRDDIVENESGFLCKPSDPDDLALAIARYFGSDLYENLADRRPKIKEESSRRHSWEVVGEMTREVYSELTRREK